MAKYTYLLFNLFVILPVVAFAFHRNIKLQSKWKQLLLSITAVAIPFVIWDVWAAQNGHWFFNEKYIFSTRLWGLPIEEILFFICVPAVMWFVWEVVKVHVKARMSRSVVPRLVASSLFIANAIIAIIYFDRGYTRSVAIAACVTSFILSKSALLRERQFWVFQGAHLGLFIISNTFLTSLPIISYGSGSIIGIRIGTIPLEDFMFSYVLVTALLFVYRYTSGVLIKQRNVSE